MAYLYQVIMVFPRLVVVAEPVFQVISMSFLGIEPFILYRPSSPPGFRQLFYIPFCYRQVRQKIERVFSLPAFPSLYEIDLMLFIHNPCHIVMPHLFFFPFLFALPFFLSRYQIFLLLVIPFQVLQFPVFPINSGYPPLFKTQQVTAACVPAFLKETVTGIQAVPADAYRKRRKFIPQLFQQPVEGIQLAVLFFRLFLVLREFSHDAHINIRVQHKLRFQHVIIVFRIFLFCPFVVDAVQTFPIRFLMAAVQLGPVYDDLPAAIAQPGLFKCPAAYQFFTSLHTISWSSSGSTPFR